MGRNFKPEKAPDGGNHGMSATDLTAFKKTLLQNLSICTNYTGKYEESIANLTTAIGLQKFEDANSAKAYYLRSVAYMKSSWF